MLIRGYRVQILYKSRHYSPRYRPWSKAFQLFFSCHAHVTLSFYTYSKQKNCAICTFLTSDDSPVNSAHGLQISSHQLKACRHTSMVSVFNQEAFQFSVSIHRETRIVIKGMRKYGSPLRAVFSR